MIQLRNRGIAAIGIRSLFVVGFSCSYLLASEPPRIPITCGDGVARLAISGSRAYVGSGDRLLQIDISDPSALKVVGQAEIDCGTSALAVDDGLVFVVSMKSKLQIYRADEDTPPHEISSIPTRGSGHQVSVFAPYVILCVYKGMQVVDLNDPTAPVEAAMYETSPVCLDIALEGSKAILLEGWIEGEALQSVDISAPWSPELLGKLDLRDIEEIDLERSSHFKPNIKVVDGYAYVADPQRGLLVFDVSEPSMPALLARHEIADISIRAAIEVAGRYVFVGSGDSSIVMVDVSTPSQPFEIGRIETPGNPADLVIRGDLLFVADGDAGFRVIDISDLHSPVELDAVAESKSWNAQQGMPSNNPPKPVGWRQGDAHEGPANKPRN